jgi:hypothetical protein
MVSLEALCGMGTPANPCCTGGERRWRSAAKGPMFLTTLDQRYLATSWLWRPAVAGRQGVQASHVLRSHARRTWRHREGARHVHHTAIGRARSPSHPCASVTAGGHGCPRAVAPLRHPTARRDTPVAAHGRSNDPSAAHAS